MSGEDEDENRHIADLDLSEFAPLRADEEAAPTTIDLSIEGALGPEELSQLGLDATKPDTELPDEDRTVAEPAPPKFVVPEPPPGVDPDATYKLSEEERSQVDDVVLPGRQSPLTKVLLVFGFVALFAAAVTIGFFLAPFNREEPTSAASAPVAVSADPAGGESTTPASTGTSDAGSGATAIAADAGAASPDATPEAATDAGSGFVIEDPEIPPGVRRMSPRRRARRARAHRRRALRLHAHMRYAQAEEAWRSAFVLAPDNPYTHRGIARTLHAQGRDDEAEAWEERAEAAAPMRRRRRRNRRRRRR
jgi:hypothetical protein